MKKLAKAQMGKIVKAAAKSVKSAGKAIKNIPKKDAIGITSGVVGLGGGTALLGYTKGRSDAEKKIKKSDAIPKKKMGGSTSAFAKLAPPYNKATFADKIAGAKKKK